MSKPLDWIDGLAEIGDKGLTRQRAANPAECTALAAELGLVACHALIANYTIKARPGGAYRLDGKVDLDATQACVVTLEPLPARLAESFAVEFKPDVQVEENPGGGDHAILDGPDIELLSSEGIPVGRIVFEVISGAVDPYPRKPGVDFDWSDPKAKDSPANPFNVLKTLKPGS